MRLCAAHEHQWLRWLDYRAVEPIRMVQIGNPRARDVIEAQERRAEVHRQTVRLQQALITKLCREHRGCS